MALTTTTINEGRFGTASLKEEADELIGKAEHLKAVLDADSNFATFVSGTQIGQELNDKLNQLINIMTSSVGPSVQSIAARTDAFLDRQEELNNTGV